MPVKGSRPYMEEALASLAAQGMGDDLEVIVQDADVEPDAGQSDAFNKGFAKAHGEWLFWLNADDVLLPGALEKIRSCIKATPGASWIAGNTKYIDACGIVIDVRHDAHWYPWYGRYMSVWTGGPSAFFCRDLWKRAGKFDLNFRFMMDIDLWTRWAENGERFIGLPDYLWGFRIHAGSLTTGGLHETEKVLERQLLLQKHGLSVQWFWRNVTRVTKIINGGWLRRMDERRQLCGTNWRGRDE